MKRFGKKLVKELKWLLVSVVIVGLTIGTMYGIAVLSQWKVEYNMARVEAGEVQVVEYTRWGK